MLHVSIVVFSLKIIELILYFRKFISLNILFKFQNGVFVFDEMDWLRYTLLSIRMRIGGLLIK